MLPEKKLSITALLRLLPKATGFFSLLCFAIVGMVGAMAINKMSSSKNVNFDWLAWGKGGPMSEVVYDAGSVQGLPAYPVENRKRAKIDVNEKDGSVTGNLEVLEKGVEESKIWKYKVERGDTLSSIARKFEVEVAELRTSNSKTSNTLKVGEMLIVPKKNGILYEVKEGDSAEAIANRLGINVEWLKSNNPDYEELMKKAGSKLVIPLGAGNEVESKKKDESEPNLKTYFILPARGWNWGELHPENAVDIADVCGRPVYASAEGVVVEESSNGAWNNGYGNYVVVEHPNSTRTKYAHTAKNLVKRGEFVVQGEKIAQIGNSGNTHGVSGCHLHFEVFGAKNPFAVK